MERSWAYDLYLQLLRLPELLIPMKQQTLLSDLRVEYSASGLILQSSMLLLMGEGRRSGSLPVDVSRTCLLGTIDSLKILRFYFSSEF